MSRFDHNDYRRNPGKYKLFSSASMGGHVFTANGTHDIPANTIVGIKYRFEARNQLYQRNEPVYAITVPGQDTYREFYASSLKDFVL